MLLFFYMRGEGWEYGLVYLFVVLKLLKRFFAFNFEFFNAFGLLSLQSTVPLSVSIVRLVEDDTLLIRSSIIIIIVIGISTDLVMIRCVIIL